MSCNLVVFNRLLKISGAYVLVADTVALCVAEIATPEDGLRSMYISVRY